jgi:hypothetical protein
MESNICSIFGITEGISKLRGVSVISEGGQVDKDKVKQLMLKNPSGLTNEEKEMLAYLEKVLGEEKYAKLKEAAINGDKNQEIEALMKSNKDLFLNPDGTETGINEGLRRVTSVTDNGDGTVTVMIDGRPQTYSKKDLEGIDWKKFDDVATSPYTSGVVGGVDKRIGQKIDGMTYKELSEKLKQFGYDRTYRRNLMRSVTKKFGDLKIGDELPKGGEFELPNGLKLAKGFGVASTALAGVTAVEDVKNNDTGLHRAAAIGVDGVATVGAYVATDAFAGGVGEVVGAGAAAVAGLVLAPEIAIGVGAVVGVAATVAAAGAIGYYASEKATEFKNWLGLH